MRSTGDNRAPHRRPALMAVAGLLALLLQLGFPLVHGAQEAIESQRLAVAESEACHGHDRHDHGETDDRRPAHPHDAAHCGQCLMHAAVRAHTLDAPTLAVQSFVTARAPRAPPAARTEVAPHPTPASPRGPPAVV